MKFELTCDHSDVSSFAVATFGALVWCTRCGAIKVSSDAVWSHPAATRPCTAIPLPSDVRAAIAAVERARGAIRNAREVVTTMSNDPSYPSDGKLEGASEVDLIDPLHSTFHPSDPSAIRSPFTPEVDGWAVNVIESDGIVKTVFSVGVKHFTLASWDGAPGSDELKTGREHCAFVRRMFLKALEARDGMVLERKLRKLRDFLR